MTPSEYYRLMFPAGSNYNIASIELTAKGSWWRKLPYDQFAFRLAQLPTVPWLTTPDTADRMCLPYKNAIAA